jgi:O-antigen ligase
MAVPGSTPAQPAPAAAKAAARFAPHAPGLGFARRVTVMALVLCSAGVPMLPTNEMKVSGTLLAGCLLAAGGLLLVRCGEPAHRTPLDAPLLAFGALAVLATAFSPDPLVSLLPSSTRGEGLLDYFVYIPMALAAARLSSEEAGELGAVLAASGALIGAAGVGQYYGVDATRWIGNRAFDYGSRSWGTLANPDFLGGYVALVLPIGVALAAGARGRAERCAYGAACAALYAALVGSQTRSAWGAAALGGLVLLWRLPHTVDRRRLVGLGLLFALVTAAMAVTQPAAHLGMRAGSALNPADRSLEGKWWIWRHIIPMIRERPFLGWGFSAVLGRLPGVGTPGFYHVFGRGDVLIDVAHNEILQVAVNTGLLGLAAYLWVWIAALRAAHEAADGPEGPATYEAAGILAGLAAYFVWLQFLWNHIGVANVFWVLAGTAVALRRAGADVAVGRPVGS